MTDDPGTPGGGRWEVNVALLAESRPGARVFETPLIDANYGWGERVQLKIEVPWIVRDVSGENAKNGLGNALLGVKWRFLDEEESGIAAGIYPQVGIRTLSSSVRRGLAEETRVLLPLVLQKDLGPLSANLEIGHELRRGGKPRWFAGLALGRQLSQRFELLAEIFADTSARFAETDAGWNFGGRWRLGRQTILLVSAGSGIHGSAAEPRARLLAYLGTQLLF